jgi:hypothetical protein
MQHRSWSDALLRSAVLGLLVSVGACGGEGGGPKPDLDDEDAGADGGSTEDDPDADPSDADLDPADATDKSCAANTCAAGQRCEPGFPSATCLGSCDEVACATGLVCGEWLSTDAAVGNRDVLLQAVVDPDDQVLECDDGNNSAALMIRCAISLF